MTSSVDYTTLLVVAFAINFAFTYLSQLKFFGPDNATISKKYDTLVTPDGYAFAIWGLIFCLEISMVVYVACYGKRQVELLSADFIIPFAAMCFFQSLWSVLFTREMILLSAIVITCIPISLMFSLFALFQLKNQLGLQSFLLCYSAISIHAGWTTAASIVNWNLALLTFPSDFKTDQIQTIAANLTLVVSFFLALVFSLTFADPLYCLTISWALGAISSKLNRNPPKKMVENPSNPCPSLSQLASGLSKLLLALGGGMMILICVNEINGAMGRIELGRGWLVWS